MEINEAQKRPGWLRALLWGALVIFILDVALSLMIGDYVKLMVLIRLLMGWFAIVKVNVLQLTPDFVPIFTALGVAVVALFGLHLLALAWQKRVWPDFPRWRMCWSGSIFAGLLACSLAAIAFAGLAHQIAWLSGEHAVTSFRNQNRNRLSAIDIAVQLERFGNVYPDSLNEVSWERGGMSALFPDRLLLYQASETATPEPWIYHGKGLKTDSPEGLLLLSAPRSVEGKRWVVLTRVDAMMASDEEYHAHLERLKTFTVDAAP